MLTAKTCKRLQTTEAQLQEISYAPEHNQVTYLLKHNCKRLYSAKLAYGDFASDEVCNSPIFRYFIFD